MASNHHDIGGRRVRVKYTTTPGSIDATALHLGEIAVDAAAGSLLFKKTDGTSASIVAGAGGGTGVQSVSGGSFITASDDGEGNISVSLDAGAQVAWANVTGKPSLATVATSGAYADLTGVPVIATTTSALTNDSGYVNATQAAAAAPVQTVSFGTGMSGSLAAGVLTVSNSSPNVQSDWNAVAGDSSILNKPTLAAVATSGAYADISGKPTIPTATSGLTNDSGFVNAAQAAAAAPVQSIVAGTNITVSNDGSDNITINSTATGSAGYTREPSVTSAPNPASVSQGETWSTTLTGTGYPGLVWSFYGYTGTPFTFSPVSNTGFLAGTENTPGTYTIKARCGWAGGWSDESTLTIEVTASGLSRDNAFGGIDGLQYTRWATNNYVQYQGAVVDDGGTYKFDDGVIVSDSANCLAFWSFTDDVLVAFRYNSSGVLEDPKVWYPVSSSPSQGMALPGGGSAWSTVTAQNTVAKNSSILGRRLPVGGYYYACLGSKHYLEFTPGTPGDFDGFGARDTSWSYGFTLLDDWVSNGAGQQMLAPSGANFAVQALVAFGNGATPYEYVNYGNEQFGPYYDTVSDFDISARGWIIANAGDHVVVTWDQANWKVYVEGVLLLSSTSPGIYMDNTTSPATLRFGDCAGSAQSDYPTFTSALGGWFCRLTNIWMANGTAFNQTQVSEITADKSDITGSANYPSIDHLWLLSSSSVTTEKGGSTVDRGDITFA